MNIELKNLKSYLRGIVSMNDEVLDSALDFFEVKNIKKGDYLLRQGSTCNEINYINKGLFRVFYLKNGVEVNTCFCKENSIVSSLSSFVNTVPSKEYIQALESSVIISISKDNLHKLYQLNDKWQLLSRILTEQECIRLSNRANTLSFETAKEKYLYLIENEPDIVQRVAIQYIASYLGVSRETLSRIRTKIT